LRIAFITNEFVIEKANAGGLGNYLNRISRVLHDQGHEIEIFVTRHNQVTPRLLDYNGIRVQHVPVNKGKIFKFLNFIDKSFFKAPYSGLAYNIGVPISLAKALEDRHREAPFEIVQSSSVAFSGLFVKHFKNRVHLVRLSSIIKEYLINDGVYEGIGAKLLVFLGRISLKRADIIYSPSLYSSKNYEGLKRRKIHVLRPPFFLETVLKDVSHYNLPTRYFIHFGSIGPLKGSDVLANALPKIWEEIPDFKMVWLGKEREKGLMDKYNKLWGKNSEKIIWFEGLVKSELYSVLKNAEVSVLPSKVDNLPNTVLESLYMGIPVIGSDGASIDELVENTKNGVLVPIGDSEMLAKIIISAWININSILPNGFQKSLVLNDFNPEIAASNLIDLYYNFLNKK